MTLLKPSFIETLFHSFFSLEPDRLNYFNSVFRVGRSIFIQMGFKDKADELQKMIYDELEQPLNAELFAILQAYYNIRFINSKLAYCKVGEGIDVQEVTRYDLTVKLEKIKNWLYDEITTLTHQVRFTSNQNAMI